MTIDRIRVVLSEAAIYFVAAFAFGNLLHQIGIA